MPLDFLDPTPEQQKVVLINTEILRKSWETRRILRALQPGRCGNPVR